MDNKTIQKIVRLAGLTEVESKVYVTLLDIGKSLANNISRKTGVHRRSIYDVMDRLIDKGLVNYIVENKKKYFSATNPKRVLEIIEEKQEEIKKAMPELTGRYNLSKEKQETTFFRGKEGVKAVFESQIGEGKEILVFGTSKNAHELLKYYFPHYDRARVAKKINVKMIFDESVKKDKNIMKIPLKEIRFVPGKLLGDVSTCVYGNKVAIIIWTDTPSAILINHKEVAKSYKSYFDLLWNIGKI